MPFQDSELKVVVPETEDSSYPAVHFEFTVTCPYCGAERTIKSHPRSLRALLEVKQINPGTNPALRRGEEQRAQERAERAIIELRHLLSDLRRHWICQEEPCGSSYALAQSVIERVETQTRTKFTRSWLTAQLNALGIEIPESLVA